VESSGEWAIDAAEESDTWEFQAGHIRDGLDAHLADGMPRRVRVTGKTINGPREWYLDTAADSIWFSMEEFVRVGGAQFVRNSDGAESADGSPLAAICSGPVSYVQKYGRETASYYRQRPDILIRWTSTDCVELVS
jgi:hypothetical protein